MEQQIPLLPRFPELVTLVPAACPLARLTLLNVVAYGTEHMGVVTILPLSKFWLINDCIRQTLEGSVQGVACVVSQRTTRLQEAALRPHPPPLHLQAN